MNKSMLSGKCQYGSLCLIAAWGTGYVSSVLGKLMWKSEPAAIERGALCKCLQTISANAECLERCTTQACNFTWLKPPTYYNFLEPSKLACTLSIAYKATVTVCKCRNMAESAGHRSGVGHGAVALQCLQYCFWHDWAGVWLLPPHYLG